MAQTGGYSLEHPAIQDRYEEVAEFEPKPNFRFSLPLFRDVKIKNGSLFLMAKQALFQVDINTGKVQNLYRFQGKGEPFEEGSFLNFHTFTLLENGTLILAGVMMWDHDLWYARLPGFPKN